MPLRIPRYFSSLMDLAFVRDSIVTYKLEFYRRGEIRVEADLYEALKNQKKPEAKVAGITRNKNKETLADLAAYYEIAEKETREEMAEILRFRTQ